MKIVAFNNDRTVDFTNIIIKLAISSSIYRFKKECNFRVSDSRINVLVPKTPLKLADRVVVTHEGVTVFDGIVASITENVRGELQYRCYDWGFYLESSKFSAYYEEMSYAQVIKDVMKRVGFDLRIRTDAVSYTHLRSHETKANIV